MKYFCYRFHLSNVLHKTEGIQIEPAILNDRDSLFLTGKKTNQKTEKFFLGQYHILWLVVNGKNAN